MTREERITSDAMGLLNEKDARIEALKAERGHFARRLERVEAMVRAMAGAVTPEGTPLSTNWNMAILADGIIKEVDAWAQGQGGAK